MILRLTVRDVGTGAAYDVEVSAASNSSVRSLLAALPGPVSGRRCFVGAVPLDPAVSLADSPLLAGSVLSVGGPGPVGRLATDGAVGVLEVVSGPDAGLAVALRAGVHPIARSSGAALPLRDTDVSRGTHALLEVFPDGTAVVTDGGSSNGTYVDGVRIVERAAVTPTTVLQVGGDALWWTPVPVGGRRLVRAPDGRLDFDRAFAHAPVIPSIEVTLPASHTVSRGPMAATFLLGAAASVLAALFTQTPILLLGAAVSVAGFVLHQLAQNKQDRAWEAEFNRAREAVEVTIAGQVTAEQRAREALAPSPAEIVDIARGARSDLWTRRAGSPHALALRVGVADEPASVTVRGEPWSGFRTPTLSAVPITVDLRTVGVLGVIGDDDPVHDVLRWLLVQLATLRGPDDLRMVLLSADPAGRLAWARWLPHVDAGDTASFPAWIGNTAATRADRVRDLRTLVATRRAERGPQQFDDVVVVLDGALALRDLPGMDEVLRDGPAVGVYLICADRHSMNECRGLIETSGEAVRLTRPDGPAVTVRADRLDAATAERLARALAPMRDRATLGAAQNAIPGAVRLLDLLDIGAPTADDVLALWERGRGPRTRVVLGADATGPVHVDLAGQGPHTMLGGATGAGKSVLLQTLVTSLLLANRPDELNLVLVDFKGGSAFLPFERCPHVVSLIRSTGETPADVFDDAAAARVLASIRAEVSRRESLLARHDGEIDRYWQKRLAGADLPPLPRLVLIFDEFGRVLDAAPDFVKELVNVAAKGRSLGMHLVLATQSLQGKLSPELKNNVSLRVSLRQNEQADSTEVLGVPDAATIPGTQRGRGMILCTTAATRVPQPFQSGYLGDPPPEGGATPVTVRVLSPTDLGAPRPPAGPAVAVGPTDQDLAIAAIEVAAGRSGATAPFRPILPPLPATLTVDELPSRATAAAPATAVPFGLADDPAQQAQPAAFLDLAGVDRLLVAGGPQSGRTTFARTLITGLAGRFRPDQAHLYVVERHPAGLAEYASLPHCGGVFSPAEPDRVRRLVTWLGDEVQRRTGKPSSVDLRPAIVVVIDGWEHFEDHGDPAFVETSLLATLRGVITAGAPLGVHVVPLGGQDMLNHRLPTLYNRRLLLPFPKEETRRMQLQTGMTSPPVLPGRAVEAGTGRHVQVCLPTRTAADGPPASPDPQPHRLPRRFPALPTRVDLAELGPTPDSGAADQPRPGWIPLGIGGPDTTTVGIDLFQVGPHLLLISGAGGTGRTTAAATVVRALLRQGIGVLAVAPLQSPLPKLLPDDSGLRVLTGATFADSDLRAAVAAFGHQPYAVVVDDVDRITVLPTEQGFASSPTLLDDLAHPSARGQRALVVTADAAPLLTGFPSQLTRLVNAVMMAGARLVLAPNNRSAAVAHNITLEPDQYLSGPPGRGYLSVGRDPVLVQVAV